MLCGWLHFRWNLRNHDGTDDKNNDRNTNWCKWNIPNRVDLRRMGRTPCCVLEGQVFFSFYLFFVPFLFPWVRRLFFCFSPIFWIKKRGNTSYYLFRGIPIPTIQIIETSHALYIAIQMGTGLYANAGVVFVILGLFGRWGIFWTRIIIVTLLFFNKSFLLQTLSRQELSKNTEKYSRITIYLAEKLLKI